MGLLTRTTYLWHGQQQTVKHKQASQRKQVNEQTDLFDNKQPDTELSWWQQMGLFMTGECTHPEQDNERGGE